MSDPAPVTVDEVRRKLAEQFCRVVAVLDDKIEDPERPEAFTQEFDALRKRFDQASIICHFHNYPTTYLPAGDGANSAAEDRAFKIAAAADLVVLDWQLGGGNDPGHALLLIRKLTELAGLRFVLINTTLDPVGVAMIIEKNFPIPYKETHDDAGVALPLLRMRIGDSFFLSIRHKTGAAGDASLLLQEAQRWLRSSFPDHLHWAGLEIAIRVRDMLPKVVAAMPRGTDAALAHQLLFQRNSEIAEQITDVFLDELKLDFGRRPLQSVADDVLFESLKACMSRVVANSGEIDAVQNDITSGWKTNVDAAAAKSKRRADIKKKQAQVTKSGTLTENQRVQFEAELVVNTLTEVEEKLLGLRQRLEKLSKNWEKPLLSVLRHEDRRGSFFPSLSSKANGVVTAAYLRKAYAATDAAYSAWASLKESAQLPLNAPNVLFPGCVLERTAPAAGTHEWLLCVTPACDCYWRNSKGYLFVAGLEKTKNEQSDPSVTQTWFLDKHIAWNSKILVVKSPGSADPHIIAGYRVAGAIRTQVASRIIHRVWSYQSRVGIDTSEYYRELRGE